MEMDAYIHANCAQMFVAALVIVDNKWINQNAHQLKLNKMWHIPTVE